MAKKKKSPAKVAKKKTAAKPKAKPAAKAAKKAKAAKAAKKASTRTPTAKKAATKKPVKKAVINQKKSVKVVKKKSVEAPKAAEAPVSKSKVNPQVKTESKNAQPEKVRIEAPQKEQPVAKPATESKPLPPVAQMHTFQIPNQRPIAHKPVRTTTDETRTRYSEEELREFEKLILEKLEKAREEYKILKDTLNRTNDEGTDATSGGNTKVLEDGAETAEKENLSQLAARQQKYITNLENALIRIKNGTYGICSVTGKLISKERLIAVPHTTQSIEAKMMKQD
jgi:RNA polymerase-binding transcription factor DksA